MILILLLALMVMATVVARDPEARMKAPELIRYWGYEVQIYDVTTKDGYILTMHRIPRGKDNVTSGERPAVLLLHSLFLTSTSFLTNLPDKSLGFMLADAGFDVWLGNNRGNGYSKRHETLDSDTREYWQWSWDEMASFDVPAMVDAVREHSGRLLVDVVGHAQGALILTAAMSRDSDTAAKINNTFLLAPLFNFSQGTGYFKELVDPSFGGYLIDLVDIYGHGQFLEDNVMLEATKSVCKRPDVETICHNMINIFSGESEQFNMTRFPVFVNDVPSGTSIKNMNHYMQTYVTKTVTSFDYGKAANKERYGMEEPPSLDVAAIRTPMHIYYGDMDLVSDAADLETTIAQMHPMAVASSTKLSGFTHLDFVWGERAHTEVYPYIIDILRS